MKVPEMKLVIVHRAILNLPGEDINVLRFPAKKYRIKGNILWRIKYLSLLLAKTFSGHFSPTLCSLYFFFVTYKGGVYR